MQNDVEVPGRHIRMFLVDGSPNGMITAEIIGWTGHVLFAPRVRIADLLSRPEASKTGVYLLVGEAEETGGLPQVYVGEGDNVGVRIASHNRDKEFWDKVFLITSKDTNLTKSHVRFLEMKLLALIRKEARATAINSTAPDTIQLPEAETSDMQKIMYELQVLLPTLGLDFVRASPKPSVRTSYESPNLEDFLVSDPTAGHERFGQQRPTVVGAESPTFVLTAAGMTARAVEVDGKMVVLQGSEARGGTTSSIASNVAAERNRLLAAGRLKVSDRANVLVFAEDVSFTSPSAAAQAVMGTSRNGRTDWAVEDDPTVTYGQWQEEQIRRSLGATVTRKGSPNLSEFES